MVRANSSWAGGASPQRLLIVPRHPVGGLAAACEACRCSSVRYWKELAPPSSQVWIRLMKSIPDFGTVERAVKQRVFAVEHSALEDLFADVVIDRRARLAQKYRQSSPVPQHIVDRLAQG